LTIAAHVPLSIFANMADDFEGHMIGNPAAPLATA
jgi:hypothetical protein